MANLKNINQILSFDLVLYNESYYRIGQNYQTDIIKDNAIDATIKTAQRSGRIRSLRKTVTPILWDVETTTEKIMGSFKNIVQVIEDPRIPGRLNIICLTDCGVKMKHVISLTGNLITTFFLIEV